MSERKPMPATITEKTPANKHPLVGAGLHSLNEDTTIQWQGHIVDVFDGYALVQLFSWIMGEPTERVLIPLRRLASLHSKDNAMTPRFYLYEDVEHMNFRYEHSHQHRNRSLRDKKEEATAK